MAGVDGIMGVNTMTPTIQCQPNRDTPDAIVFAVGIVVPLYSIEARSER